MTATAAPGRVSARDLAAPLSAAASIKARHVQLHPNAVVFSDRRTAGRVPFAGRAFDGDPIWLDRVALARVLRSCRGGDVLLQRDDQALVITSEKLTARVPAVRDDVPEDVPSFDDGAGLIVGDARTIARGLLRAASFASRDETRPILCAIAFAPDGKLIATDSYRLAVLDAPDVMHEGSFPIPVEINGTVAVATAMAQIGGEVTITDHTDRLVFAFADQRWSVTTKDRCRDDNDGRTVQTYPNYRMLLPDDSQFSALVDFDAGELAETASLIADTARRNAPLIVTVEPDSTRIHSDARQDGVVVDRGLGDVVWCRERQIELGLNPSFLTDTAAAIAPDRARMSVINPLRPALLSGADDDLFLLMPIRLNV